MTETGAARALIATVLDISVETIATDAAIADIPAWDSIGHVRILLAIVERLGRDLGSAEITSITGVASIAAIIG